METCCSIKHEKTPFYEKTNYIISSLVIGLVLLVLSFVWGSVIGGNHLLMYFNPAWVVIVMCGLPLVVNAGENLFKNKKIKTSLLITTAMIACVVLEILNWCGITENVGDAHSHSNLFAAGEVAFLMMLGELLEDLTVRKSRKGIEKLINLSPTTALVNLEGEYSELPIELVRIGDIVKVLPYQQIPVDGVVKSGNTAVNQSAITGESLPIDIEVGDNVYAGTWNESGAIEIEVKKENDNTTLARMVKLVKDAENNKAPIARLADKWAGYIVPAAIILSVVVLLLSKYVLSVTWSVAVVRSVTVLVVFCPCSLALATPTAIAAGIGNCAGRGILVKSGSAIEEMAKVDTVVFDKTGTLTSGQLRVTGVENTGNNDELYRLAGSAEAGSEHPLAKTIVEYCKSKTELVSASNTQSLVGVGVSATIDGKKTVVAKLDYFQREKTEQERQWLSSGYTIVGVSADDVFLGAFALSDTVKDGAREVIAGLNAINIKSIMLTGDNEQSALCVSSAVGIDSVKYSLLPEQKLSTINQLKLSNNVCMIGDGINDAPSLAAANCSVTMGAVGSDVALEVADMAIMNDDITKVVGLIKFSRQVIGTIKRNIIIAMCINLIAVVLSFVGVLTPIWGALVHNCSSLLVVASSASLLLVRAPQSTTGKASNGGNSVSK